MCFIEILKMFSPRYAMHAFTIFFAKLVKVVAAENRVYHPHIGKIAATYCLNKFIVRIKEGV